MDHVFHNSYLFGLINAVEPAKPDVQTYLKKISLAIKSFQHCQRTLSQVTGVAAVNCLRAVASVNLQN